MNRRDEPRGRARILGPVRAHQHAASLRGEMAVVKDRVQGSAMFAVLRVDRCSITRPTTITSEAQKIGDARCRAGALASIHSFNAGSEMIISPATHPMSAAPLVMT